MGTNALSKIIQNEIAANGGYISFARFMELALYHPMLGYYMRNKMNLGKAGDFTTAPEISPLFAQCFATQCADIGNQIGTFNILELGAGTGRFAGDLLTELTALQQLPLQYYIKEISPSLRQQQRDLLKNQYSNVAHLVSWVEELPEHLNGIIIANEVLDALPVHRFQTTSKGVTELGVGMDGAGFTWTPYQPSINLQQEADLLASRYHLPLGYTSEINLQLTPFLQSLITCLQKGVILLSDYGYGEREYYHQARKSGTLTCFYQHHYHENPLLIPGEQDITAHVDFTRTIEIASQAGCRLAGFTTQAGFLLSNELIERASKLEPLLGAKELFTLQQQIKTLTMPSEMGERIKIMALTKGCHPTLRGFNMLDRRREL